MDLELYQIENSEHQQVLTQKAEQISFPLSADEKALIEAMKTKLLLLKGVGLAAPQVGVTKRIICINISDLASKLRKHAQPVPMTVFLNPSYQVVSSKRDYDWEGCFSVKNTMGKVPRADKILVDWEDVNGEHRSKVFIGFYARVLQHEIDHLDGQLILDRFDENSIFGSPQKMIPQRMAELNPEQQKLIEEAMTKQD